MLKAATLLPGIKVVIGAVLGAVSALCFQLILSRVLSIDDYATFVSVNALINVFVPLACVGCASYLLAEAGKGTSDLNAVLKSVMRLVVLASCASVISVYLGLLVHHHLLGHRLIVMLALSLAAFPACEIMTVKWQIEKQYTMQAVWMACINVSRFVLLLIWLAALNEISLVDVVNLTAIVGLSVFAFACTPLLRLYRRGFGKGHVPGFTRGIIEVVSAIKSYFVANLVWILYSQGILLFASLFFASDLVAGFAVALLLVNSVYLLPSVLAQKYFLLDLNKNVIGNTHLFYSKIKYICLYFFLFSMLAILVLFIGIDAAFYFYYGDKFLPVMPLIKIILMAIPLRCLEAGLGAGLANSYGIGAKLRAVLIATLTFAVLAIPLTKMFGGLGLGFCYLLTEALLSLIYFFEIRRLVNKGGLHAT